MFVKCFQDWNSEALPEADLDGFYNTSLPVFLFKMVDQNVRYLPFLVILINLFFNLF